MLQKIVSCLALVVTAVVALAGQQRSLAVTALAGFEISGTLVNANTGQPIPRARVAIAPVTQRDNFTTLITHEDGRFTFPNLTPGKYTLTAQARGYLLQSFNQHDQLSSSIVVGPDLDSSNLLFRLAPEGAISGVVTDEAGEPVRNAQVMLYFTGLSAGIDATRPRGGTRTNDEGAYHFGHLLPGHYLVAVSAQPWYAQHVTPQDGSMDTPPGQIAFDPQAARPLDVAYPVTFSGGVTDAGAAVPIVLGHGDKAVADVSLQPVPAVRMRLPESVDFNRGSRVELQKRVLEGPPVRVATQFRGNSQGRMEIVGLAPGRYTLTTNLPGPEAEKAQSQEIDIDSNGEIDSNQANVYVPVSAKVQFDGGAPAGQPTLQLLNKKSGEAVSAPIGSDGTLVFRQGVVPGAYEVSLFTNSGAYAKSITAAGARVTGRTIEIRPGAEVRLAIGATVGQGSITGTALREGKPLAGAMIVLVPADPAHNQVLFRRDQSDSDGTFALANVVPGAYTLLALENGWDLAWMKPEVLKNYLGRGAAVQVQPNGKYELKVAVQ
ncbi:MAG TPA: carboxypeptidase-like regulatory domain-containing protein [Candidatus Angelobacter sp.]